MVACGLILIIFCLVYKISSWLFLIFFVEVLLILWFLVEVV